MSNEFSNNATANAPGKSPAHALVADFSLPVVALVVVLLIIATGSGYF